MSILANLAADSGIGGKPMATVSESAVDQTIESSVVAPVESTEVSAPETTTEETSTEEIVPDSGEVFDYNEIENTPVKSTEKPKTLETTPATPASLPDSRDYSGFTEQEVAYLKKTGNDSFAYLSKELRQAKADKARIQELEKSQEENVSQFSDPEGFRSTDEFKTVETEYVKAGNYIEHWKKQLANIHDAKPWIDIEHDANGKPIGVEREASAEALSEITDRLMSVKNYQASQLQKAEIIQQQWNTKSQKLPAFVEAKTKEFFPEYHSKQDDKNYKQMEAVLKQMGQHKNPVAKLLNTMYAAHMDLLPKYIAMEAEYKKLKGVADARQANVKLGKQVEPSPTTGKIVKSPGAKEIYDYEEIAKSMQ